MEKKKYTSPQLQLIELDNGISLELESNPPVGPSEVSNFNQNPEHFDNTVFKA